MAYAAEQQVKFKGMATPATIISGPHRSPGGERYLIRKADGNTSLVPAAHLAPVDTRLEKVAEAIFLANNGAGAQWNMLGLPSKEVYRKLGRKVLEALDGQLLPENGTQGNVWVELTPEEAGTLSAITGSMVSGTAGGPREYAANVARKLEPIIRMDNAASTAHTLAKRTARPRATAVGVHFAAGS
jgi:hypothetical protein